MAKNRSHDSVSHPIVTKVKAVMLLSCSLASFALCAGVSNEQSPTGMEEQRALLSAGPWICDYQSIVGTVDEMTAKSFENYAPGGGSSGRLHLRSPDFDLDIITAGNWEIREPGVLTMPKSGWFSFENGLYSGELGEEAFNLLYDELLITTMQELNEDYEYRIVQLTEDKLALIDAEDDLFQCARADLTDLRLDFNINYIK